MNWWALLRGMRDEDQRSGDRCYEDVGCGEALLVDVRTLVLSDLDAALDLWRGTEGLALDASDEPAALRRALARNPGLSLVAVDTEFVVGAVLVLQNGRRGVLSHLAVAKAYRGQGLGRLLVETALSRLADQGVPKCHVHVLTANTAGAAFWDHLGWQRRDDLLQLSRATPDVAAQPMGVADDRSQAERLPLLSAAAELGSAARMVEHCLRQLSDEQIWQRTAPGRNSIGNLVLHLMGNLRQWLLVGLGGGNDRRDRPAEFATQRGGNGHTLMTDLMLLVSECRQLLSQMTVVALAEPRTIQGFEVTGWDALWHTIPHFRGHTQEIVMLTRQCLGTEYQMAWRPPE